MSQVILYQSEDGRTKLDVRLENQTVWLNQKQLTELFGKAKGTISEHIKHIFEDGELTEDSVVRLFRTTAADGKTYEVAHYNLDMVLALGFRVRSPMAVRFRQWAADKLKEYIVKKPIRRQVLTLDKQPGARPLGWSCSASRDNRLARRSRRGDWRDRGRGRTIAGARRRDGRRVCRPSGAFRGASSPRSPCGAGCRRRPSRGRG